MAKWYRIEPNWVWFFDMMWAITAITVSTLMQKIRHVRGWSGKLCRNVRYVDTLVMSDHTFIFCRFQDFNAQRWLNGCGEFDWPISYQQKTFKTENRKYQRARQGSANLLLNLVSCVSWPMGLVSRKHQWGKSKFKLASSKHKWGGGKFLVLRNKQKTFVLSDKKFLLV